MTPDTWQRVKDIFAAAVELPPPRRAAYVRQAAGDDPPVEAEVLRLLALHRDDDEDDVPPPPLRVMLDAAAQLRAFHPGEVLAGRYLIRRFLAAGGMGEVYEAEDMEIGQRVALKTLHPEVASEDHVVFLRKESSAARRISHPNVCRTYDLVQTETATGRPLVFLTMELLEGESLAQHLQREGPMSERQAFPLIRQMVAGLAAAHAAGVVHRDFKTSNIMLAPRPGAAPRLVITDFGLARPIRTDATTSGSAPRTSTISIGTPAYIAPEQIRGGRLGPACDIYALGVVMYELLSGAVPFEDDSPLQMAMNKLHATPPSLRRLAPDIRPNWERTIRRCLEPEPSRRFADVRAVLAGLEVRSRRTALYRRVMRRRQGIMRGLAAALLLCLVATAAWRWWPVTPTAAARADWESGVTALHAGEALTAAGRLEDAVARHRLPALARSQLAMAWLQAGFPARAQAAQPFPAPFEAPADRLYRHAVDALLRGDRGEAEVTLRRRLDVAPALERSAALADVALLHASTPAPQGQAGNGAEWQAVLAVRPQYAPALLWTGVHHAHNANPDDAQAAFLAAETYFRSRQDQVLATVVSARRGLANLAAGQVDLARQDIPSMSFGPLRPGLGYGSCQRVVMLQAGLADDFQMPPDPVERHWGTPPPTGIPPVKLFDEQHNDMEFQIALPMPAIPLCDASLQVGLGRSDIAGSTGDLIHIGREPLTNRAEYIWATDGMVTRKVANFTLAEVARDLLKATPAGQTPLLEITVGDDTFVDYMKLTVVY